MQTTFLHDPLAPLLTKTRAGSADMGTHFHADSGNHLRSREELLEGHARPLPLPHDSMQTLGPLGVTPRSREDHVTSWEDMETIFMPSRPLIQNRRTVLRVRVPDFPGRISQAMLQLRTITDPHVDSFTATCRRQIFMVVVHAFPATWQNLHTSFPLR